MSTRYFTNVLVAVLGGALVVFTQSLSTGAVTWTGFGVAIVVLVVSLLAQLDSHRGIAQRALDAVMSVAAATLIVFSAGAFSGTTLVWLVFAFGLAFVGVALAGLTLHEIEGWREAHNLGELHWLTPVEKRASDEIAVSTERVAA
jgi:hypothetical protein